MSRSKPSRRPGRAAASPAGTASRASPTQGQATRAPAPRPSRTQPPRRTGPTEPRAQPWRVQPRDCTAGPGHLYVPEVLAPEIRRELLTWLASLHPLWEQRYASASGAPARMLLRPVVWLGSWQFACLDYYRPPRAVHHRCVWAEPYPPVLATIVGEIEGLTRRKIPAADIPPGWKLSTCLVNYYGDRFDGRRWVDVARVGAHRDFEPGPVASLSFGAKALLQFVRRGTREHPADVAGARWLEDNSLQVFAGPRLKDELLHRVQRVVRAGDHGGLDVDIPDFRTRRINLTFRYVPDVHVCHWSDLPAANRAAVLPYVDELAAHSAWWAGQVGSRE